MTDATPTDGERDEPTEEEAEPDVAEVLHSPAVGVLEDDLEDPPEPGEPG